MRRSEFELLRIVSMLMVLGVHFDGAALDLPAPGGWAEFGIPRDIWRTFFEAFTIIGVNCFTMISGYFGIRLSAKGVFNFLFQAFFFSVGLYVLAVITGYAHFDLRQLADAACILTRNDLWYVPAYFLLMLASPWLNAGAETMSQKRFATVLAAIMAFTFWGGWWRGMPFNATGYTPIQLMTVYLIARYIRLHNPFSRYSPKKIRIYATAIYLLSTTGIIIAATRMDFTHVYAYNSPLVIMATISFFYIFTTFRFSSRTINFIASSAFAAYLIHKNPLIWGGILKPFMAEAWKSLDLGMFTLLYFAAIIIVYAICMAADAVRKFIYGLIIKPIH